MSSKVSTIAFFLLAIASTLFARPSNKFLGKKHREVAGGQFACASSQSQIDQNINNVRARLLGGGDCWWDLDNGSYIVPKADTLLGEKEVSALFAASVWLGGLDPAGNLKLACQTYRTGDRTDFWPGPLDQYSGTTTAEVCKNWDQHFRVTSDEIRLHLEHIASGDLDPAHIPAGVKGWPARGNPFFIEKYHFALPNTTQGLASFFDQDGDDEYNPLKGDYPSLEIRGCPPTRYPDEMIFWIYNDEGAGAQHSVTQGKALQMEIQAIAFGYKTNDELNDMTFQRYKLINRADDYIDSTFFAMWVDADLGCFSDDYIGCDPKNGLMYVYNQDKIDGSIGCECPSGNSQVNTYCDDVPMVGVDFFRGPLRPINYYDPFTSEMKDTVVELGMTRFMYYMGGFSDPPAAMTEPGLPAEFYNYLTGSWRDGTPLTEGGSGYHPGSAEFTNFALPGAPNDPEDWSMCSATLPFGDRSTIQSSGPFRLAPGAVNELIIGVPFAPSVPLPCPDLEYLLRIDKKAQALFNSCFVDLPPVDAPQVDWIELNKQLVAVLTNESAEYNNYKERYESFDYFAPDSLRFSQDSAVRETTKYKFEGYKIYQLIRPDIPVADFDDPDVSRLVYQVDKKNGVGRIFNWEPVTDPQHPDDPRKKVYAPSEKVSGADAGLRHTFSFTEDQFSTQNIRTLVNHKRYYYAVVPYSWNNYAEFKQVGPHLAGQQSPYQEGGKITIQTVIPRPSVDLALNAAYGDGVEITRLEGVGAGSTFLEVTEESRNAMLEPDFNGQVTYAPGHAPINVIIFNPFEVQDGEFELEFVDSNVQDNQVDHNATWVLRKKDENGVFFEVGRPYFGINEVNERIFEEYGISVTIAQTPETGDFVPLQNTPFALSPGPTNGAIGAKTFYKNPNPSWISGIVDQESGVFNFIQTGAADKDHLLDPKQGLSSMGNGFFVPYPLATGTLPEGPLGPTFSRLITPAWTGKIAGTYYNDESMGLSTPTGGTVDYRWIRQLPNVDIVLTPDRSKWSRCIVVETASEYFTAPIAGVTRDPNLTTESGPIRTRQSFDTRYALSVGKEDLNGDGLPDLDNAIEPPTLPDPTASDPQNTRPNPRAGQPLRGMGWFPGYVVDVETGQRLNIFFGENSCYSAAVNPAYTGRDMLWNPTNQLLRSENNPAEINDFLLGGQHWIYVTRTPYDECAYLRARLNPDYWSSALQNLRKREVFNTIAWTGLLLPTNTTPLLSLNEGLIPNEALISLRVENPYQVKVNTGNGHPKYGIRIHAKTPSLLTTAQTSKALDSVKVVPNPYYGFSDYESGPSDRVVKITNPPAKCIVTIYGLDGSFIRQFKRDETYAPYQQYAPAIEWDLKNQAGRPVASGVYLIHVNAYEKGERTLKWFGVK